MNWFKKLLPSSIRTDTAQKKGVPEGLWSKCDSCGATLYRAELERNLEVCPKCGYHQRITARKRLMQFLDPDSGEEIGGDVLAVDRLKFRDSKKYKDRLIAAQKGTGEKDALIVLKGRLENAPIVVCAFEFSFMGGSMGFCGRRAVCSRC